MSLQDDYAALGSLLNRHGYLKAQETGDDTNSDAGTHAVLVAMFSAGVPVSQTVIAKTGLQSLVSGLLQARLLETHEGNIRSNVSILRRGGLLLAGDPARHQATAEMSVSAFSKTTDILSNLLVPGPFRHAVDMGCGSGVLALEMASQATQVSGTDINPRALALARINAAMNGIGQVRFLEGSLLEPLGDTYVDQIVGNLPFVMSPDQSLIYRDGDRPAAQLLREAIAGASRHLAPGGVAQMLCNWASDPSDPAAEPQRLVAQCGLDAIAITYANRSPREHAKNWNQSLATANPQEFERVSERWQQWFEVQNITSIAFGSLTLRRPIDRAPSFRHFNAASWPVGKAGRHIERLLLAMSGEDPFATPDAVVPRLVDHMLYQTGRYENGGYKTLASRFEPDDSIGLKLDLEPGDVQALARVNGTRTLAEVIDKQPAVARCMGRLWHLGLLDMLPMDA